ncbi:coiled-coil domain-containing protein 18 isoform X1 [Pelobates fuscus]|uniref:coiled-coil domain-containing protein 18 isoform X1 n=1 Tax=Pelobates fuscus TaxID=191477 RepID=UPI002FE482BE
MPTSQMEPNFSTHQNQKPGSLTKTVQTLKTIADQFSRVSSCEHSLDRAPLGLTLEDLEQPSCSNPILNMSNTRNKIHASTGGDSLRRIRDQTFSSQAVSFINTEEENSQLRLKLNTLREQNASLSSKNHSLTEKLESVQVKLFKSKSQVHFFETSLGTFKSRIVQLEEHIVSLEAKAEAHEKALRKTEDQLQQNHHTLSEKESILHSFREELKKVKVELYESNKQCKRAETQRNAALLNAEELTRAFQQYKANVAKKLEKVKDEEELLNKNFTNCEQQRKSLQERCGTLEKDLESTKEHLRVLQLEKGIGQGRPACGQTNNTELISLLTHSNQRILRLENELEMKEKLIKEQIGFLQENKELKDRLAQQSRRNEMKISGSEIGSTECVPRLLTTSKHPVEEIPEPGANKHLIADLRAQLLVKESENRELQDRLLSCDACKERGGLQLLDAEPVRLASQQSDEEKYVQLEAVCKQLQTEKERLALHVKELQEKLSKAQCDSTNARHEMTQRTNQFQLIQKELMEKASKASSLQQEVARKCSKISAIQKLLEEKSMAYSTVASRKAELEHELMNYKEQIFHLEENISKEHEEVRLAFEQSKHIHADQQKELQNNIEHLQCQLNMKTLQIAEQDRTIKALQQDSMSKQQEIKSLDHTLTEIRRELDLQTKSTNDVVKILEDQIEDETDKVRHLESALALCKEELVLYLQQLEENRESFANQIKKKSEELHHLQMEIKHRTQSLQEINEENVRLQQTLQQQQQMLQQGTERIGDLEDTQAELEKQVCKLELQIEKQRCTSEEELRKTEESFLLATKELDLTKLQVLELNSAIEKMQLERDLSNEKMVQLEEELAFLRCQEEAKSNKLNEMEITLRKTQAELDDKRAQLAVSEETMSAMEKRLRRKDEMDSELQDVKEELENNIKHIQKLEETLTKTHISLEEKQSVVQTLTEELRTCRSELEDREHEILDMNQALNDRNWELKQRAAQLNQLDMSIREHKGEMEQKIIRLESDLEKSRIETEDLLKQISCLDERNQQSRNELCEKDFELLQKDQTINQLKKEIEKHRLTIDDIERTVKAQEFLVSEHHQENLDLNQQVRLARERMQITHLELVNSRQQLAEAQKESDHLCQKLEAMDQVSREKLHQMKQELEESQDTICNIKTELEARNEVIKATNEVLIMKESEVTRLKARISAYTRTLGVKTQNSSIPTSELFNEYNPLESYKYNETQKMCRSISASDISLTDLNALDLPETMLEDIKSISPSDITMNNTGGIHHVSSHSINDSSFNPLEYTVDDKCETASDCTDLGTLSGMLKYIKKEMKRSSVSPDHSPTKNMWIDDGCQGKQEDCESERTMFSDVHILNNKPENPE